MFNMETSKLKRMNCKLCAKYHLKCLSVVKILK